MGKFKRFTDYVNLNTGLITRIKIANIKQILHNLFLFVLKAKNSFDISSSGGASGENFENTSLILGLIKNVI